MTDFAALDMGLLLLRIGVGFTFAAHGFAKVFRGGRLDGTGRWFEAIGMRPGFLHARLAAVTEIVAGIFLAVGLLTPLASAAITATMLVAAWTVHRRHGFFIVSNGWEYNFVLALVAVSIAIMGPGSISLDSLFFHGWVDGWWSFFIAGGLGVLAGILQLLMFYRPQQPEREM